MSRDQLGDMYKCHPGRDGSGSGDRSHSGGRLIVGRLRRHRLPVGRLRQQSGSTKRAGLHPVHGRID